MADRTTTGAGGSGGTPTRSRTTRPKGVPSTTWTIVSGQLVMPDVKFFVVQEANLNALTNNNDDARAFKEWAFASASFAGGLITSALFVGLHNLPREAEIACSAGIPGGLFLAVILYLLGRRHQLRSEGDLKKIKESPRIAQMNFNLPQGAKTP